MTIECYHNSCKYHSCNFIKDDGPFCDEDDCKATKEELAQYDKEREEYLKKYTV